MIIRWRFMGYWAWTSVCGARSHRYLLLLQAWLQMKLISAFNRQAITRTLNVTWRCSSFHSPNVRLSARLQNTWDYHHGSTITWRTCRAATTVMWPFWICSVHLRFWCTEHFKWPSVTPQGHVTANNSEWYNTELYWQWQFNRKSYKKSEWKLHINKTMKYRYTHTQMIY